MSGVPRGLPRPIAAAKDILEGDFTVIKEPMRIAKQKLLPKPKPDETPTGDE